VREA
jgi:hypothetical protein